VFFIPAYAGSYRENLSGLPRRPIKINISLPLTLEILSPGLSRHRNGNASHGAEGAEGWRRIKLNRTLKVRPVAGPSQKSEH